MGMVKKNRAQVISEYAGIIFLILAVITAVSVFLKRALQANIRDARNYMITQVNSTYAATQSGTTPSGISYEYEPYYVEQNSEISSRVDDQADFTRGAGAGKATTSYNETTEATSTSRQLPPGQGSY